MEAAVYQDSAQNFPQESMRTGRHVRCSLACGVSRYTAAEGRVITGRVGLIALSRRMVHMDERERGYHRETSREVNESRVFRQEHEYTLASLDMVGQACTLAGLWNKTQQLGE
jgi:hypothetical protein